MVATTGVFSTDLRNLLTTAAPQTATAESPRNQIVLDDAPDDRLCELVQRALRNAGYAALRKLKVVVDADHVRLTGEVPTYHLKQVAQSAVRGVDGVKRVDNQVDVVLEDERSTPST